jgi:hypothetical protein
MTRRQTLEVAFHIGILVLLGVSALTAYFWIFPLGIVLEIVFWFFFVKWR